MPTKRTVYTPIYVLRSQCDACKIDTMRTFTLKDNESPDEPFTQMERWVTLRFPKDHGCIHKITFTRQKEKGYMYYGKLKQVVKV